MIVPFSDRPYTILAPSNTAKFHSTIQNEEQVKQIILNHVAVGRLLDVTNVSKEVSIETLRGRTVYISRKEDKLLANDANILQFKLIPPNGVILVLDNYLFGDEQDAKKTPPHTKLDVTKPIRVKESKSLGNVSFVDNVLQVLSYLKSGVRVFQHFLSRSNVSKLLEDGEFIVYTADIILPNVYR